MGLWYEDPQPPSPRALKLLLEVQEGFLLQGGLLGGHLLPGLGLGGLAELLHLDLLHEGGEGAMDPLGDAGVEGQLEDPRKPGGG